MLGEIEQLAPDYAVCIVKHLSVVLGRRGERKDVRPFSPSFEADCTSICGFKSNKGRTKSVRTPRSLLWMLTVVSRVALDILEIWNIENLIKSGQSRTKRATADSKRA